MIGRSLLLLFSIALACFSPAQAQGPPSGMANEANEVEGVVVTARRIGVPVWRVSNGSSTVVLIGQIQGVSKDARWRADELERAVAQADTVLFPHDVHGSPADVARTLWRARSIVLLPKGKTLGDYVDSATLARLRSRRPEKATDRYFHPWVIADDLLGEVQAGELFGDDRVTEVVRRAARKHRKKREAVGVERASRMLDAYFAGPATHVPCLSAALAAAEAGPEAAQKRVADWTRSRVPEVIAAPVELAFDVCWPWGAARQSLRRDWSQALARRLAEPGVTVAVTPLLYAAEPGGLLDNFVAQGLVVEGPRWRADGG
jgi:hypothetical protein